jgi:colanic acid/amylovoran biosynthesis glycosyltransferase
MYSSNGMNALSPQMRFKKGARVSDYMTIAASYDCKTQRVISLHYAGRAFFDLQVVLIDPHPGQNGEVMALHTQAGTGRFQNSYESSAPKAILHADPSILVVTGEFPALSETFVLDQITGLLDRGFPVDVVAFRKRDESDVHEEIQRYGLMERVDYGITTGPIAERLVIAGKDILHHVSNGKWTLLGELGVQGALTLAGMQKFRSPFKTLRFASILEDKAPNAILCHFGDLGAYTIWLRNRLRLNFPILTVFHGYEMSGIANAGLLSHYRFLFKQGDYFLPVTDFWRRQLISHGCPENRISVHRMGIRVDTFDHIETGKDHPFTFLSVGRLIEKKGHACAIRALAKCVEQRPDIPCKLVIIGDGPLQSELQELSQTLGVADHVELYGSLSRDNVRQFLRTADAFLLPSVTALNGDMEGLPVAILEAMASKLPVLSTYHSGIPEAVEDGVNGFLVAEHDVGALASRMMLLLDDRDLARRLGEAGRSRARLEFDIEYWNNRLADLIRQSGFHSHFVNASLSRNS